MKLDKQVGLLVHVSNVFAMALLCVRNLTAGIATLLRLLRRQKLNLPFKLSSSFTFSSCLIRQIVIIGFKIEDITSSLFHSYFYITVRRLKCKTTCNATGGYVAGGFVFLKQSPFYIQEPNLSILPIIPSTIIISFYPYISLQCSPECTDNSLVPVLRPCRWYCNTHLR
jgi:hypothetical protein